MQSLKTFRLFISSTFNDFKKERQILHEKVFPSIDKFLLKNYPDYVFQPIDLRWGVNVEAQLDQKTLEVCLSEVKACKHYLHPNFLIMSGNRYGWVPLPYAIERNEFESIINFYRMNKDTSGLKLEKYPRHIKLLKTWYKKDTNNLMNEGTSYAYVLKERDRKSIYNDWKKWEEVENDLRDVLQAAAIELFKEDSKMYNKYFLSATEAETEEGIFPYLDPTEYQKNFIQKEDNIFELDKQYVFAFIRDFKNTVKPKEVINFQEQLTNTLLSNNILREVSQSGIENTNTDFSEVYLDKFEVFMKEKLQHAIVKQINMISTSMKALVPNKITKQEQFLLINEKKEQENFKYSRSKNFVGREEILNKISDYVNTYISTPIVLYGESGMGKSALMAKSIDMVSKNSTVYYRFVGVTDHSSNSKSLLVSLFDELQENNIIPSIGEYETDINAFNAQLNSILKYQLKEKIIIYIDALDQLLSQDYLLWLPEVFPENLKVIISILRDDNYNMDSQYYDILNNRYENTHFIDIAEYSLKDNGKELLYKLLLEEGRTLTVKQMQYVLECFAESNYSPLYLKIAIEIIKNWKSFDIDKKLKNNTYSIIGLYIDNLTEIYHIDSLVVDKVLNYIHASKSGLSEKELIDILSEDLHDDKAFQKNIFNEFHESVQKPNPRRGHSVEYVLPMAIWSRLHEFLKTFLTYKNIDGYMLMKYFHRQFTTVVDKRYKSKHQQYHQKLSDYFLTLQNKDKNWEKRYYNVHMLDEVPYQLFCARRTKKLKEIYFDLEFAGAIYNNHKQDDFKDILERATELSGISKDEMYLWESFYREKEHLITYINNDEWRAHQSLFQLAYSDGKGSPLANEANKLLKKRKINFSWMKLSNRENIAISRKGIVRTFFGHSNGILDLVTLETGEILSAAEGEIFSWDEDGNLIKKLLIELSYPKIKKTKSGECIIYDAADGSIGVFNNNFLPINFFKVQKDSFDIEELNVKYLVFKSNSVLEPWFEIRKKTGEEVFCPEGYLDFGIQISDDVILYNILELCENGYEYDYVKTCIYNYVTKTEINSFVDKRMYGKFFYYNDCFISSQRNTYIFNNKMNCIQKYKNLSITDIIVLKDKVVAFSKHDNLIYFINLTGIQELRKHKYNIRFVQVLESGNLISIDIKGHMLYWKDNGEFLYEFEKIVDELRDNVVEINSGDIVAGGRREIYVWAKYGKLMHKISNLHNASAFMKKLQNNKLYTYALDGMMYQIDFSRRIHPEDKEKIVFQNKVKNNRFLILREGTFEKWNVSGGMFTRMSLPELQNISYVKELRFRNTLIQVNKNNIIYLIDLKGKIISELKGHTRNIFGHIEIEDNILITISYNEFIIWNKLKANYLYFIKGEFSALDYINENTFLVKTDNKFIKYSIKGKVTKESKKIKNHFYYKLSNYIYFIQDSTDYSQINPHRTSTMLCMDINSLIIFYVLKELKDVDTYGEVFSIISKLDEKRLLIKKHIKHMVMNVETKMLRTLNVNQNFNFLACAYNIMVGIDDISNHIIVFDIDGNFIFSDKSLKSIEFLGDQNRCIVTEKFIYLQGMFGSYKKWKHDGTHMEILYFPLSHIESIFIEKDNNFLVMTERHVLSYKFYKK